jgi:TPR repeat protein
MVVLVIAASSFQEPKSRSGYVPAGGQDSGYSGDRDLDASVLIHLDPDGEEAGRLDPEVLKEVGSALLEGRGVHQDEPLGVKWYRRAAELGSVKAMHNLGVAFDLGRGVPENPTVAVAFYAMAAERGLPQSGLNLCLAYHQGRGARKDPVAAARWCAMAAEGNQSEAQLFMGDANYNGECVNKDLVKSV